MQELLKETLAIIEADQLKVEYKYIYFRVIGEKPKTKIWGCYSRHNDKLGEVKWFSRWRQYCYFPEIDTVYSIGCLEDIFHFIQQLKGRYK